MNIADQLHYAKKVQLYLLNATTTWDTTILYSWIVPAAKRWFIMGGMINRDASATVNVDLVDAANRSFNNLLSESAATGIHEWPDKLKTNFDPMPRILDAGEKIRFAFGAAQSTAAYISGWVLEIDV